MLSIHMPAYTCPFAPEGRSSLQYIEIRMKKPLEYKQI